MSETLSAAPFRITPELMAEVRRTTATRWQILIVYYFAIGCCIFAALAGHFIAPDNMPLQLVVGTLAVLCIFFIMQRTRTSMVRWQLARAPGLQRNFTISIDETGVRTKTEVSEGWVTWRGVFRVSETERAILIFTQPGQAYPIPRSSFANAEESNKFYAAARGYWQAAQNS